MGIYSDTAQVHKRIYSGTGLRTYNTFQTKAPDNRVKYNSSQFNYFKKLQAMTIQFGFHSNNSIHICAAPTLT